MSQHYDAATATLRLAAENLRSKRDKQSFHTSKEAFLSNEIVPRITVTNTDDTDTQLPSNAKPIKPKLILILGPMSEQILRDLYSEHNDTFGNSVPTTSRAMKADEAQFQPYEFSTNDQMMKDIRKGNYVEWGSINGHIYGTKFEALSDVLDSGRHCLLQMGLSSWSTLRKQGHRPMVLVVVAENVNNLMQLSERNTIQVQEWEKHEEFYQCLGITRKIQGHQKH